MSTLAGVLCDPVTVETVTWTGTTPAYGYATPVNARIEPAVKTVQSPTGDSIVCTRIAYLPGDTAVTTADRITLPDGTQPLIAQIDTQPDSAGNAHHLVLHLAPAGTDTVTISRAGSAGDWDPATGLVNQTPAAVIWSGTATVSVAAPAASRDAADQNVFIQAITVSVPLHTPAVAIGDIVSVTGSDPYLNGADLRVTDISHGAGQFMRRLTCAHDLSD